MSKPYRLLSPLESVQNSWGYLLRDFRQWCSPAGQQSIRNWKTRRVEGAIIVAKTNMVDDAEALLRAIQRTDNADAAGNKNHTGTSVSLPVMVTAISAIESSPEYEVVKPNPTWVNVVVDSDPLQRVVQMRAAAVAYRCQIAFFAPDVHAASSIANQFINYFKHERKRSFDVGYEVGYAGTSVIKDHWNFKVAENTIYPDKISLGIETVHGITVDCTIVGLEPNIVGLGHEDDDITDTGEPDGSIPPNLPPITGGRDPEDQLNAVVIEADVMEEGARHTRVNIDPETGVITEQDIKGSP